MEKMSPDGSHRAAKVLGEDTFSFRRQVLIYMLARPHTRYVYGHVPHDPPARKAFADRFQFITLLRDPVSRWISHYFFNRYKQQSHARLDVDLDSFLESPEGRRAGAIYVDYFTTGRDDLRTVEAIREANQALDNLDLVGTLEEIDRFKAALENRFGRRLAFPISNESPVSRERREAEISPSHLERIEEICRPDQAVYEHATEHLKP